MPGALVASVVADGIGERLPHPQIALEFGVRKVHGVIEQHPGVASEDHGVDARVGGNSTHRLALGDADSALGCRCGPLGEAVAHACGLEATVRLGSGELGSLLQERRGVEVALRPEGGAGVDHYGDAGGCRIDHSSELLDAGHEFGQRGWVGEGRIDRAQR